MFNHFGEFIFMLYSINVQLAAGKQTEREEKGREDRN